MFLALNSNYFKSIFEEDRFSESHQKQSTIRLPLSGITSEHFELLLDYFYTGELELDRSNAVAAVYFGDYFGIPSLKKQALAFVGTLLHLSNEEIAVYYQDARKLLMEDLQKVVASTCIDRPNTMSKNSELVKMPNAIEFWRLVWLERNNSDPSRSGAKTANWSDNLAHLIETYFDEIDDEIDRELFCFFTQSAFLPVVTPDAAFILMDQEHRLGLTVIQQSDGSNDLTCLQNHCTDALLGSLRNSISVERKLRKLQPIVLRSLLSRMIYQENRVPRYMHVHGAPFSSVDGKYINKGYHQKKPYFKRFGCYDGEIRTFALFFYKDGRFYISVIPKGEGKKPGTLEDVDLYDTPPSKEVLFPPKNGWRVSRHNTIQTIPWNLTITYKY